MKNWIHVAACKFVHEIDWSMSWLRLMYLVLALAAGVAMIVGLILPLERPYLDHYYNGSSMLQRITVVLVCVGINVTVGSLIGWVAKYLYWQHLEHVQRHP